MAKIKNREIMDLLETNGFEVSADGAFLFIRRKGVVNPADVRQLAATILSQNGYQGYLLKEVYAYMGSKKPYQTEIEGHVELEPWEDFEKKDLTIPPKKNRLNPNFTITPLASQNN